MQSLLLLLRGRQGQGDIVGRERQGEEGGKEGHGLRQWQTRLHQQPLQFAQLLVRGSSRSKRSATRSSSSIHGYKALFC